MTRTRFALQRWSVILVLVGALPALALCALGIYVIVRDAGRHHQATTSVREMRHFVHVDDVVQALEVRNPKLEVRTCTGELEVRTPELEVRTPELEVRTPELEVHPNWRYT